MSGPLRDFIAEVDATKQAMRTCGSVQLNSSKHRHRVQAMVDNYFKNVRSALAHDEEQTESLRFVDSSLQELLTLSHTRALVSKYVRLLKQVRSTLVQLDSVATSAGSQNSVIIVSDVDRRIITTLQTLIPSAALSYSQAMADLQSERRLSWRGPATDLREALRETLDHLAPDDEVTKSDGFKLEQGTSGPTMKQKVRYILKKRGVSKTLANTPESAADSVETAVGSFVRSVYNRSSVSTHTPTDKHEVLRVRDWVRVTLCELLEIRE
jgi:predicted pPIWI-associating nuclease